MKFKTALLAAALLLAGCAGQSGAPADNDIIKGFSHVALMTSNFDATIRFYQEVFGAEDLGPVGEDRHMCWLKIGDDVIEVFDRDGGRADGIFDHIAVSCTDVDALYQAAIAAGGEGQSEPKDITLGLKAPMDARIAFVRGLAGERIELFQVK